MKSNQEASLILHNKKNEAVSWLAAMKHSWRTALRIDRSQITAVPAIRTAIGFALPLALGVLTGHVVEGVSIAGGAASLGAVGLTSTYHARTRILLMACVGIALSAFVGSVTGHISWLSVLVAGMWGFGAGLLVSLGQPAMILGLQSVVALIILSHFELDPLHAGLQAGLMFAGALFQTLLSIVPLPWQRTATERSVLSMAYEKLANYALEPVHEENWQQLRDALLKVGTTLSDSNIQSRQGKMFFGLLEEAERIRLSLIVLTRLRQNLSGDTVVGDYLDQILQATAGELHKIANELKPLPLFIQPVKPDQQIKQLLATLRKETEARHEETIQQILAYGETLRNQLHAARKLATSWKHVRRRSSVSISVPQQPRLRIHDAQAILRANLTFRSAAFRHAIRLGVALALATALYRLVPLPIQRGYWISLTALLVLKPDFTTTFTRGVARSVGTMVGAVLTTLLVSLLAPTQGLLVVLDALVAYLAFSVLYANYAIFSMFITVETVLLLTFVTPEPVMTAADRAIDTAIGGVLALLLYAIWPTWEHGKVLGRIADRLEALRQYFVAVMAAYADPVTYEQLTIHNRRMESRLARSNAEASVTRSLQEPEPHRINSDLAQGLLTATDDIARSVLALDAYLIDKPERHALPQVSPFSEKVDEALRLLVASIREEQPVTGLPDLQEALQAQERASKPTHQMPGEARADLHFVLAEAKKITSDINTMKQLLSLPY